MARAQNLTSATAADLSRPVAGSKVARSTVAVIHFAASLFFTVSLMVATTSPAAAAASPRTGQAKTTSAVGPDQARLPFSMLGGALATRNVAPWLHDQDWIVEALRTGTIINLKPIGTGITNPFKAEIEFEEQRIHAVWKPIQGTATSTNRESYCAEIAAYRLSRQLGINMVPPTVKRRIGRQSGSLQLWVNGYETGESIYEQHLSHILDPNQVELMRFLDALIDNTDRHANNYLVDQAGNLVLIDHSRAMNYDNWGPERKGLMPVKFRQDVVNGLRALSVDSLRQLIGDLFPRGDIKALHRSAQRLLSHVDTEVRRMGHLSWMENLSESQTLAVADARPQEVHD